MAKVFSRYRFEAFCEGLDLFHSFSPKPECWAGQLELFPFIGLVRCVCHPTVPDLACLRLSRVTWPGQALSLTCLFFYGFR